MMLSFLNYIENDNIITEEKATKENFGSLDSNTKGVLHELLVGYHLFGGKHMLKHADIEGNSPEEAHNILKEQLTPEQYKNFSNRAKKAAQDILTKKNMKLSDVKNVQWTSKPGDIKRATNIPSTQSEDDSDIILTDKNNTHHGLSLKASDDKNPITLSNNGAQSSFGGAKLYEKHKNDIIRDYPELSNLKDSERIKAAAIERVSKKSAGKGADKIKVGANDLRKAWLETTPGAKEDLNKRTNVMLRSVVDNMHSKLQELPPQELADHVRNSVLHAYKTPKEAFGHTHTRHFTGGGFEPEMESKEPGNDYEHFLANPENIRVTKSGTSITYHHQDPETGKTVPFAMQTAKVSSQSDPFGGGLVLVGKDVERKQDIAEKNRLKMSYNPKATTKPRLPTKEEAGSNEHGPMAFASPNDPSHLPNRLGVQQ
jgi:hypothetical protein